MNTRDPDELLHDARMMEEEMNIRTVDEILTEQPERQTAEWRRWWADLRAGERDALKDHWGWKPDWINAEDGCPLCHTGATYSPKAGFLSCDNPACAMHINAEVEEEREKTRDHMLYRIMLENQLRRVVEALGAAIDELNDIDFELRKKRMPQRTDEDLMEELCDARHNDQVKKLLEIMGEKA